MHFLPSERVALFIDGANLYSASRNLGFDVDYRNLLEFFRKKAHVIRAYYYSAVLETDEYSPLKPLTDWLAYNGYTLVTKPAKEFTDSSGRRRVKGNMDIEVAVDMLELAPRLDHADLVQRRFGLPPAGRGGAAQGRARIGRVLDPHQSADGGRRTAPPGRSVPGAGGHRARIHPPPDRAARSASGRRCARPRPNRSPTRTTRRERRRRARSPAADCPLCPRLAEYRQANRAAHPDWFNAPVPSFGSLDARLLIVGLAPGRARRQPDRPAIHRRLRRRAALPDAAAFRPRAADATAPIRTTA